MNLLINKFSLRDHILLDTLTIRQHTLHKQAGLAWATTWYRSNQKLTDIRTSHTLVTQVLVDMRDIARMSSHIPVVVWDISIIISYTPETVYWI